MGACVVCPSGAFSLGHLACCLNVGCLYCVLLFYVFRGFVFLFAAFEYAQHWTLHVHYWIFHFPYSRTTPYVPVSLFSCASLLRNKWLIWMYMAIHQSKCNPTNLLFKAKGGFPGGEEGKNARGGRRREWSKGMRSRKLANAPAGNRSRTWDTQKKLLVIWMLITVTSHAQLLVQCIQLFFSQTLFEFKRLVSYSISPKFSGKIPYVLS